MKSVVWNIQDEWQPLEAVMVGIGVGMGPAPQLADTYDPSPEYTFNKARIRTNRM